MSTQREAEARRRAARRSPTAEAQRRRADRTRTGAAASRSRKAQTKTGFRVSGAGVRFGLFCFTYLRQTKGAWAGHPLGLEPFQIEVASELLQAEREAWYDLTLADVELSPEDLWAKLRDWLLDAERGGWRVHREGLLGIPKKNGKSTMSAGLALYLLVADDEPGAEVFSVASAKDQARVVFRQAREMLDASPRLLEILRPYRDAIEYPDTDSVYKVVASDAGPLEGVNPHGIIVDEIHAHKKRETVDTLRSATIARQQPLLFAITTAGVQLRDTIGGEYYVRGAGSRSKYRIRKVTNAGGEQVVLSEVAPRPDKQRSFYFRWFEADRSKALRKRALKGKPGNLGHVKIDELKKANPATWITEAKLEEEASVERPIAIFLRYHGNVWVRVERHWLPAGKWERIVRPKVGLEEGDNVVVTVDVGLNYDTTAVTVVKVPEPGAEGDAALRVARSIILGVHEDPSQPPPPAHYLQDEPPISLDEIEGIVRAVATGGDERVAERLGVTGPLRVVAIGGDPYKFETQLQHLDDDGFTVFRFSQGELMVTASEDLYRTIGERELAVDEDPALAAHVENAVARDVGGGRHRLDKKRAADVMDGAVSLAMGVSLSLKDDVLALGRPSFTRL